MTSYWQKGMVQAIKNETSDVMNGSEMSEEIGNRVQREWRGGRGEGKERRGEKMVRKKGN